jgi:hypothetical protein
VRLLSYHEQLKGTLASIEAALANVREAVPAANLEEPAAAEVTRRLQEMDDDLRFLRVGNSIHNIHYADSLIRALVDKLTAMSRKLNIEGPTIELPELLDK